MKKLIITTLVSIVVLTSQSCVQNVRSKNSETPADSGQVKKSSLMAIAVRTGTPPPPGTFALDGTRSEDADTMVKLFWNAGNPGNYDHKHHTCIWFCQSAVQAMYNKLIAIPNADGIRFYFAVSNGQYTVIPVATTKGNPNTTSISKFDHIDHFLTQNPVIPSCASIPRLGDTTASRGATLYGRTAPCNLLSACAPGSAGIHYLSCADAHRMVFESCGLGGGNDKFNASSEWFSKEVLASLLDLMPTNGGLRIYYGKRITPNQYDPILRHGFVLVLTEPKSNFQKDYFVCIPVTRYKENKYMFQDPGDGGVDNGEECPNACEGVTWP